MLLFIVPNLKSELNIGTGEEVKEEILQLIHLSRHTEWYSTEADVNARARQVYVAFAQLNKPVSEQNNANSKPTLASRRCFPVWFRSVRTDSKRCLYRFNLLSVSCSRLFKS